MHYSSVSLRRDLDQAQRRSLEWWDPDYARIACASGRSYIELVLVSATPSCVRSYTEMPRTMTHLRDIHFTRLSIPSTYWTACRILKLIAGHLEFSPLDESLLAGAVSICFHFTLRQPTHYESPPSNTTSSDRRSICQWAIPRSSGGLGIKRSNGNPFSFENIFMRRSCAAMDSDSYLALVHDTWAELAKRMDGCHLNIAYLGPMI